MATAKQIAANRNNSKKSTGPRTTEGKAVSSQNRRIHGLLGRFEVYGAEEQLAYDVFLDGLIDDQKPVGLLETELVKKMSEHFWLSKRARRCQEGCFAQSSPAENNRAEIEILPHLERFTAYQAHHDRAFRRALGDLQTLRKQRQSTEIGFEREKRAKAEEERRDAREQRAQNRERQRENEETRRQDTHKVAHAIENEKLLQHQFNTARAAVTFEQLNARHLAA